MTTSPLKGRLTRAFSERKVLNPATKVYSAHWGADIASGAASTIRAAGPGKVTHVGWNLLSGFTGYAVITESDRWRFYYGHCVDKSAFVTVGETVNTYDPIAVEGATGNVTGRHLHFMVWERINGAWLRRDPASWAKSQGFTLGSSPRKPKASGVWYVVNVGKGAKLNGRTGPSMTARIRYKRARGFRVRIVTTKRVGSRTWGATRYGTWYAMDYLRRS